MAFAAGKHDSAFAYFGLVSVRKSTDKLVCGSLFGSSNDFCLRGAGFAVADVVKQSAVKKADILRNGRNVLMQGILREAANVDAVDFDTALIDVIIAGNKLDKR